MNQTWEDGKQKLVWSLILACFGPKAQIQSQNFFSWVLPLLIYYTLLQAIIEHYFEEN